MVSKMLRDYLNWFFILEKLEKFDEISLSAL